MRRVIVVLIMGLAIAFGGVARAGDDLTAMTNRDRHAQGRRAVSPVADLRSFAQQRAEEMARARKLWHTENLGRKISNWSRLGENVGRGPDLNDIHRSFMASADHRNNILLPEFSEVGVGVAADGGMLYVAVIFRQPADAAPPPPTRASSPRPTAPPTTRPPRPTTTTTTTAPPPPTTAPPPDPAVVEPTPVPDPAMMAAPAPEPTPEPVPVEPAPRPPVTGQQWFVAANSGDPGPIPDRDESGPAGPMVAGTVVGVLGLSVALHHGLRRRLRRAAGGG